MGSNRLDSVDLMVSKSASLQTKNRHRLQCEVICLISLATVAAYIFLKPLREERALQRASLAELVAAAKREPNNPQVFYYQGLRCRDLGQDGPAYDAFSHAATLDGDSEDIWLAWAAQAGRFHNADEALGILTTYAKAHPQSGRARYETALIYQQKKIHPLAVQEAQAAVKLTPHNADAWRLIGTETLADTVGREANAGSMMQTAEVAMRQAVIANPGDWRNPFGLGNVLVQAGRTEEALPHFQEAAHLAPNEPLPEMAMGDALQSTHSPDPASAARHLERAVALAPGSYAAQLVLGEFYAKQAHWLPARDTLVKAERLDSNGTDIHFSLAQVYRHLRDFPNARREMRLHAVVRDYETNKMVLGGQAGSGDNPQARLRLARLLAQHGDYAQAVDAYRNVLAHTPSMTDAKQELQALLSRHPDAEGRVALPTAEGTATGGVQALLHDADALLAKRDFAAAENAYRSVLERDTKSALALQGVGLALYSQGKGDEAFGYLDHAVTLDPKLNQAQFTLALLLYHNGFADVAAAHLETLVKQVPDRANYWYALGQCDSLFYVHYARAAEAFQRAVDLEPGNPGYIQYLARAKARMNQPGPAEKDFRHALALAPTDPAVLEGLGSFLADHPDLDRANEAETLLQRVLEQAPNDYQALNSLGSYEMRHNNARSAVVCFERAAQVSPDTPANWYALSRAYLRSGNRPRADQALHTAQSLSNYATDLHETEEQVRLHLKDPARRLKLARLYAQGKQYAKAINQYSVYLALAPGDEPAKAELKSYEQTLAEQGLLPKMNLFNGMVTASIPQP
jgi:tetratricopeptide (TPR) repeat protein